MYSRKKLEQAKKNRKKKYQGKTAQDVVNADQNFGAKATRKYNSQLRGVLSKE